MEAVYAYQQGSLAHAVFDPQAVARRHLEHTGAERRPLRAHSEMHALAQVVGDRWRAHGFGPARSECVFDRFASVYLVNQQTGPGSWHDHDPHRNAVWACIYVVDGVVEHDIYDPETFAFSHETLRSGEFVCVEPRLLHAVHEQGSTVHVYSGPEGGLRDMRYYSAPGGPCEFPTIIDTWRKE